MAKIALGITCVIALLIGVFVVTMAPPPPLEPPPESAAATPASSSPASSQAHSTPEDFELPLEKQKDIWASEHVTFEIETRLGGRIKGGIKSADGKRIAQTLRDDFQGSLVSLDGGTVRQHAGLHETHAEATGNLPGDKAAFLETFQSALAVFTSRDSTGLRVLKLDKLGDHEWQADLLLTVGGRSADGAILEFESHATARVRFDADEDLDSLPVIASWNEQSRTLRSREHRIFEEVTQAWGLTEIPIDDNWNLPKEQVIQYRFQMAVADYDLDGRLDIAVATRHNSLLLRWDSDQSRFVDVTASAGLHSRHIPKKPPKGRLLAAQTPVDLAGWIDYDNDGYPDLVLGNRLYHNDQGNRFEDVTDRSGLRWGLQSMGVLVADYDADGLLDLYILEQASAETRRRRTTPLRWVNDDDYGEPNQLWHNEGNGRFRNVTAESNAGGGRRHSLAGTWFFYDDDRYPDLYIANDFNENVLLRNRGDGTFEDVSHASNSSDFATSMGVAAGDIDNNGTSDLYVANMFSKMGRRIIANVCDADYPPGIFEQIEGSCAGNRLYVRDSGSSAFTEHGEPWGVHAVGWAYAPAMADFDNDGWLDLYATTGFLSFERGRPDG